MYFSRAFKLFLVVAVMFPILFGGLLHAVVPHTHSDNAVITSDFHSSFRHEEQVPLSLPVVPFIVVLVAVSISVSYRTLLRSGLRVRERQKLASALRRGTLAYRRFG